MAGLLQALVGTSEKAAHIARLCRREEPLFQLLVAEKKGTDRNRRFLHDFKTLADVLIQEVIKHDLGKEFPDLRGHIHGEESNEFQTGQGDTVTVRVCATAGDTAALLLSVLEPEREAAELLAAAVHRDVELSDAELTRVELSLPTQDLAIWIDPIGEGGGCWQKCPLLKPRSGAHRHRGQCPLLKPRSGGGGGGEAAGHLAGQPRADGAHPRRWQGRYHWGVAYGGTKLSSLSPPQPRPVPCVVLSRAEGAAVRGVLDPLCGGRLRFAAGAGYKLLCVILGLADAYVLAEGTTFAWDACAPHAILRALGGGVVDLAEALRARREGDAGPPPELLYNRPLEGAVGAERWANRGGLVAYGHPQHLEALLAAL
ncbi:INPP phosphatase, partial [Tricholaema leucomelas]|nr:INPP phosphatase [Tricholaema leucomelas]